MSIRSTTSQVTMGNLTYEVDKTTGFFHPAMYPGEGNPEKWVIPEDLRTEYSKLNSVIETKYTREYLKICAFYNKLFPALRASSWITSSYNVPSFTSMDQERTDTGTGISSNYLKQIVDQIVARQGTVTFEPALIADLPTLEYIVYKDEVERLMRKQLRTDRMSLMCTEVFHDAAIVGYSHVFINPITHVPVKANDYEIGMFEAQYNNDDVTQMLYRNYAFPVTGLAPYLAHEDEITKTQILEDTCGKAEIDLKLFFDCPGKRVVITIGSRTLKEIPYMFDNVQMVTFRWDVGFSKVTSTSLFDLLYPTQREVNHVNAKIQQLIRLYKGALPVFNSDVDLSMKAITNGSGECLYVDSSRPIDTLMTVINPTPLDAQLTATKVELKTDMYEMAGIQSQTYDIENIRAAATVVALDQRSDVVFQAQLDGMSRFIVALFKVQARYNSVVFADDKASVNWHDVCVLLDDATVQLKPVMATSPLGTKATAEVMEPNYIQMATARCVLRLIKGELTYDDVPYTVNMDALKVLTAMTMVKMTALAIDLPETVEMFMMQAFIDDIKQGKVQL